MFHEFPNYPDPIPYQTTSTASRGYQSLIQCSYCIARIPENDSIHLSSCLNIAISVRRLKAFSAFYLNSSNSSIATPKDLPLCLILN